jgi:protease-4
MMSRGGKIAIVIVGIFIGGLVIAGVAARMARQPAAATVLEIKLDGPVPEQTEDDPLTRWFAGRELSLVDHLDVLRRARDDRRISGLFVVIDRPALGFGRVQELRDAIRDFQAGGKWATCYLETAGEFASGNREYYLATACGSIWMAPPGDVNLIGVRAEVPFLRGTLDLLGIYPDYDHIGKYKTAKNLFTDTTMTEAHRESMDRLVDRLYAQMVGGIAEARKMTADEARDLVDRGPFTGPQALENRLIDALGYRDQVEEHLREKNGGRLPIMKASRYLKAGRFYERGPRVALIHAIGGVARGRSESDSLTGMAVMGSDTIAAAIRKAREDGSIKAIVLRVDSPGGSYVASDIIWREVSRTRGVKPIVVSMGDVAASGGYFVSMAADRIVAAPGTITASIGVVAGKFVTTGFWSKIGITSGAVQRGRHATYYSGDQKYTPEERLLFGRWLERIYEDFVGKAARGRGKTRDAVHAIAQGRIWVGEDALEHGLVDELGGLPVAIRRALEAAGLDPEARVRLVQMPEPRGLIERLFDGDAAAVGVLGGLRHRIRRAIQDGPFPPGERVLSLPVVPDVR